MADLIDELIEGVTVDAYGADEQLWSFRQAFEDNARFPFIGRVVGVEVDITEVDFDGDERHGLVAVCRRAGERHTVSLLDVTPSGPMPLDTWQLFEAYRRWSGATPLAPPEPGSVTPWSYPRFASIAVAIAVDIGSPLALNPMGDWDPTDEYWGEPGDAVDPFYRDVIASGVRPCFEMEQVIPGVQPDDWNTDPILEAMDLHHAGHHRAATRLLEDLLAIDVRCVDAWAHLGLVAFETRGPGPAAKFYETGVAVAEASLPPGFAGVLPRGMIDNRPFMRCLHGLALCAWRQRRWDNAEAMFTARIWLDPTGSYDALACLEPVRARQRWTQS